MWPHTACGIETQEKMIVQMADGGHMWPHTACGIETPQDIDHYAIIISHMWPHTACGIETRRCCIKRFKRSWVTCDLIPLAVLKQLVEFLKRRMAASHVTSYRLRYWNLLKLSKKQPRKDVTCDLIPLVVLKPVRVVRSISKSSVTCDLIPLAVLKQVEVQVYQRLNTSHMWPHTACGIETVVCSIGATIVIRHMWPHTACGIETRCPPLYCDFRLQVTCDLIPLAVLKPEPPADEMWGAEVTCDLIPLAVLKLAVWNAHVIGPAVTCDLIPLAVLKLFHIWL